MSAENVRAFFTNEFALLKHKQKGEQQEITSIRTANESHLYSKKFFHKIKIYFRKYEDFGAGKDFDKSNMGDKTTKLHKQNPVSNGYYIVSDLNDVSKIGYYSSTLGYCNVDWLVNEVIGYEKN